MTAISTAMAALFLWAAPVDTEAFKEQFGEAIRRHDGGDYAGAISIYRSLLKDRPHDPNLVYEISLSMMMGKSPPDELIAFAEKELASKTQQLPQLYASLASAYDDRKEFAKGEAALRKGLKTGPKSVDLHFNLGINLSMQGRPSEAVASLHTAAQLKPQWSSVWRSLAMALDDDGKRFDAILARVRFVVTEPRTQRGGIAAQKIWAALMYGVEKGEKQVTLTVGKNPDVDDLYLTMLGAQRYAGFEKRSDGEFFVHALSQLVDAARPGQLTPKGQKVKPTALRATLASFFVDAQKAGVLEALAWEVRRAAGDREAQNWFGTHQREEEALSDFLH